MAADPRAARHWAHHLARNGFLIFPLSPNSRSPQEGMKWKDVMTADHDVIDFWFDETPDMNYGVCAGPMNVIIDIDIKENKQGDVHFAELESQQQESEKVNGHTFTVQSPSGGFHYYLSKTDFPVGNSHRFPAGIDVRGAAGYVVGPGGKADGIPYTVVNEGPILTAPAWIKTRLKRRGEVDKNASNPIFDLDQQFAMDRAVAFLKLRPPAIEGANGNDHTYATAVQVKDFGISEDMCLQLMMTPIQTDGRSWNDTCIPPWDIDELTRVVGNAYHYGTNRPGSKGGILELVDDFTGGSNEDAAPNGDRFASLRELMFRGDDITRRPEQQNAIIPGWLLGHGMTALLAKRGGGKTVVALDLVCRLACDMDWHGLQMEHDYVVIYLCGEDDVGFQEQLKAWIKKHGAVPDPERFIVMAGIVDLMSAENTRFWTEFLLEEIGDKKALIVADTWQRASSKGAQNKDEDMQLAVHHLEAMARSLRGSAIACFHPPKADSTIVMGSSVIENSSVGIITITNDGQGNRRAEVTRIKGKGTGNFRLFKFEEVMLDEKDKFGNQRTGVVPVKKAGTEEMGSLVQENERVRAIWAKAIRQLIREDMEKDIADRQAPFTINAVADVIEALPSDHPVRLDLEKEQFTLGSRTVRRSLTDAFNNEKNMIPHEFEEDGCYLCLVNTGSKKVFQLRQPANDLNEI